MQLSDREIQNTLDLLKKKGFKGPEEEEAPCFSDEEIREVQELAKKLGGPPEVRHERIEKLKKALQTSSYSVTDEEVAKKIIGRLISDKLR